MLPILSTLLKSLSPAGIRLRVARRTYRFRRPATTSRGAYTQRQVWVVVARLTGVPGVYGVGECAPLPDLSADASPDYEATLRRFCAQIEASPEAFSADTLRPFPSMQFGLETALLSLRADLRRDDRFALLPSDFAAGLCAGQTINGLVWMGAFEQMCRQMEEKLEAGFRCVKLKIGAISFDDELELLRRLRRRYDASDVELRVDANGAFRPEDALVRLERLAAFSLHSIEQPIRAGQWAEMAELVRRSPLPIALDEELIGIDTARQRAALLDAIRPHYLVLKPSLHGGLAGAAEWMHLAAARGVPFWVTSALETNVGLNALAQFAEVCGRRFAGCYAARPAETLEEGERTPRPHRLPAVHGLGTGALFVENYRPLPLFVEGDSLVRFPKSERAFRREVKAFAEEFCSSASGVVRLATSGSTGSPTEIEVPKAAMRESALATARALSLQRGDAALLCLPMRYVAGKMMAVRALVCGLRLVLRAPSLHPLSTPLPTLPAFAAFTPAQVAEMLRVPDEAARLRRIRKIIIGGGAIPTALSDELRTFPGEVWSTYGMTETLSHIALRRLSGTAASDAYRPLSGVSVSLSTEGTLVVSAPKIGVASLTTNDLAEILPDGTFRVLGRRDNVVVSGGMKLQIEALEARLASLGMPFVLTAVPSTVFGEALTMLYVGTAADAESLRERCQKLLERREVPKHFFAVGALPLTETGKPARAEARRLATALAAGL